MEVREGGSLGSENIGHLCFGGFKEIQGCLYGVWSYREYLQKRKSVISEILSVD